MRKILLIICVGLFLTACGGGGGTNSASNGTGTAPKTESAPTKFMAKVGEKEYSFDIKDAVIWNGSLPYFGEDGKQMKQGEHNIILGSYDFEGEPGRTVKAGQTKVVVKLSGEIGTEEAPNLKVGTYSTGKNGAMTVSSNNILIFDGSKEVQNYETYGFSGEVKIISVEGDSVKGEIDIKTAKQLCKGTFTAKIKKA